MKRSTVDSRQSKVLILALAAVVAVACGKKGDPQPPLPRGPRAVSDLTVEQEGDDVVLTFAFPDRLLTGAPLTDLASVEVYRVLRPSPELLKPRTGSAPPSSSSSASSSGSTGVVRLPGEAARREATNVRLAEEAFYQQSRQAAVLSLAEIAESSHGASVVFRDPLLPLWSHGAGADPIAYAVVSVRRGGERSPISNIVVITPAVAPDAPVFETAIAEEGRVCLEWQAPEKDVLGQPAHIGGYRVYRRNLSEAEYTAPLNVQPVIGTSYVDTTAPYGIPIVYTLRATVEGNPNVEGLPAEEMPFLFRDVFPPAAPARLDALSEGSLVRLLWDPVDAPDLAGYLVFRAEGTGEPVRLTKDPVADPFYTDEHVAAGKRYRYTVRSIDRAGNQSPPGPEASAEPF